jgi:glycosyltransferase involved in cell wall biosynthesis
MGPEMAPLVSVLLPTRNRLEFLRYAMETVVRQDDGDWEVVVSDNDSEEDIAGHVEALGDGRIRYARTPSFVPVTDNWNNALALSSGRFVVMLGDDDGLMPGYVARIRELTARYREPEVIYQGAWLYAYPGVDPAETSGYVQPYGYAEFMRGAKEPFVLDPATRRKMVAAAMGFRVRYGFNMQFSTVSRALIDRLAPQGPFFQSAFPDYYATNVAFLTAREVLVEPRPLVAIGVTPKSYGFFHMNDREDAGKAFLEAPSRNGERPTGGMPGSNINTGWLAALEAIASRYPSLVPAPPARRRFRCLQALSVYEGHFLDGTASEAQLAGMEAHLRPWERALGRAAMRAALLGRRVLPAPVTRRFFALFHHAGLRQYIGWYAPRLRGGYGTLIDVFERPPAEPPPARHPLAQRLRKTAV